MRRGIVVLSAVLLVMRFLGTGFGQSEDKAFVLVNQGKEAYRNGRYEKALECFKKSLEIFRSREHAQGITVSLNNIGRVYDSLDRHDEALEHYEEALKVCEEYELLEDKAIVLNGIGGLYKSQVKYDEALECYHEALKICEKHKVPQIEATILTSIGGIYDLQDKYDEAIRYYRKALKKVNLPEDIAAVLNNMGGVCSSRARYDEALRHYERALAICQKLKIPEYEAIAINNIGVVYGSFGLYDKALKYYEQALKMKREYNLPLQSIARTLTGIGGVYKSLARYDEALKRYEEALKIDSALSLPREIAADHNNIGELYCLLGRYDEAFGEFKKALAICKKYKFPRYEATTISNISGAYCLLGRYDDALKGYQQALEIDRELNLPREIATDLNNMGGVYLALKDPKEAEAKFREAEKELAKAGFEWRGNPGMVEVCLATGRYEETLRLLEEITPRWFSSLPYQIFYHHQKALALKGNGKLKEASGEFLKAVLMIEEMREGVRGEKMGFFGGGRRTRSYHGLVAALSERAIRGEGKDKRFSPYGRDLASAAFYFSESTKARVLLEAMVESRRESQRAEIPEELNKKERFFLNQIQAIDSQWEEPYKKGEEALGEFKKRKGKLILELGLLVKELRESHPQYTALYYPKPVPPEDLPLRDGEILLEYLISDEAGYLFEVRKGGVKKIHKIPIIREALEAKVRAFMEPMNSLSYEKFSVKEAKELYDLLLAEPLKDVDGNEKIIIIPDGILGLLPFEALVIREGTGVKDSLYAGDRFSLSYYQSAAVLALLRRIKGEEAEKVLFALGNPVYNEKDKRYAAYKEGKGESAQEYMSEDAFYGLATRREWGKTSKDDEGEKMVYIPLPETEDEVRTIVKLFGIKAEPPDVLLGVLANETNLRRSLFDGCRYLHFATHADLPGKVQGIKEPFLLLGQVENKGKDDGFLTLTEVLGLNLKADMVVLSACLTGRGKVMEGEGVANFARAFHHAGARSVVVSLWEVASDETTEYMKLFYQYLKEGKTRAEALGLARSQIKAKYPNPFYWAPFILHGEG